MSLRTCFDSFHRKQHLSSSAPSAGPRVERIRAWSDARLQKITSAILQENPASHVHCSQNVHPITKRRYSQRQTRRGHLTPTRQVRHGPVRLADVRALRDASTPGSPWAVLQPGER